MAGKISIAGNIVVASGSVLAASGQPVTITPVPAGDWPLKFTFVFLNDGGSTSYKIEPEPVGLINALAPKTAFRVVLSNFDNSLGQGLTSPIVVGSVGGRALSLMFASYLIGQLPSGLRVLHYTFTLAGEQDV